MTTTTHHPFLDFRAAVELIIATADQQQAMTRLAEQVPGRRMDAHDPWFHRTGLDVLGQLVSGAAALCPHLGPGRGFGPMYAQLGGKPLRIDCRLCLAVRPKLSPVDDNTCDRCSVYARGGLVGGAIPIGPLMLLFGVCGTCAGALGLREAA